MPIYEYHCEKCGHEFEVLQKSFDVDEMPCETCGATAKRMISNTSFVLKGTGWYVTDYCRSNSSGSAAAGGNGTNGASKSAESAESADSAAAAPAKPAAESKPAATAESSAS